MALIVPNNGEGQMLKLIFGKATAEDLELRLFSSDTADSETNTASTYTECSGSGYSRKTLTAADWTVTEGAGVGGNGLAAAPLQTFTLSGALTAYGYYLVGASTGVIYFAERFTDGPYITPSGGGSMKVTPRFELS